MDNTQYIEDLYRQWQREPGGVDKAWDVYFSRMEGPPAAQPPQVQAPADNMAYRQSRVDSLLWAYRDVGYLYARLNPLGGDYGPTHDYLQRGNGDTYERLTLKEFGIAESDLDTVFSAGRAMKPSPAPLRQILSAFQETYCGPVGVEFLHIQDKNIRRWLIEKMESTRNRPALSVEQKRTILQDLLRTEALEHMLHQSFVGQKRFSLEGSESIVPGLHFLVDSAGRYGIEDFVIGTTHRGRLSILNTILRMTPEEIFSRFEDSFQPGMYGGGGDVKYHIGYETDHVLDDGGTVHISMASNASHLESVDPVVEGKARALQDKIGDRERKRVVPILLHGDAAFSGQGVVAEVLNLASLRGYTTGGTLHIIINNQIGFTTPAREARSSFFPTDVAKMLPVPIFHVNGDDPEALVYVADLALQFRQTFGKDCIVDVFCFRRYGHNEADEPAFTHPRMYQIIAKHPGVATLYGERCAQAGIASKQEQTAFTQEYMNSLKQALDRARSEPISRTDATQGPDWTETDHRYSHEPVDTGVPQATLQRIGLHVNTVPEGFQVHPTLARIVARKRKAFEEMAPVDWSSAEALAFGSLLLEGVPVRLSGEDSVRGTFSQRHLTWWDTPGRDAALRAEGAPPRSYTPLQTLAEEQAPLRAFDSPLSEFAVLGFEYGYSLIDPHALVAWEAQFGDFVNGAQVTIDNYIASAECKWGRMSGLVLLLPHGIEGQGPDHSNARLERFLQLAARENIQVGNLSTPAQYFHALRRQVKLGFRKPLVLMTPKSLLRHPKAVSPLNDLAEGGFHEVLDDTCDPAEVERILLCSGKVYYDLLGRRETTERRDVAIVRVEMLYPFPEDALGACLDRYRDAREFVWVQEEPRNYGAWMYVRDRFSTHLPHIELHYFGREESACGATASMAQFQEEQKRLVEGALGPEARTVSGREQPAVKTAR
jgi:2-oxoglutarate dehydrogenase E1 component